VIDCIKDDFPASCEALGFIELLFLHFGLGWQAGCPARYQNDSPVDSGPYQSAKLDTAPHHKLHKPVKQKIHSGLLHI
jgi:hypothetical protein